MSGKPKFSLAAFLFLCSCRRFCLPLLVVKPTHLDKLTAGRALLLKGTSNDKNVWMYPSVTPGEPHKEFFKSALDCIVRFRSAGIRIPYLLFHICKILIRNRLIRTAPAMQSHRWKCWFGVTKGEGCQLRQLQICTFWSTSVSAASHISGSTTPVLNWRRMKWSHSAGMTPKEQNFRIWDHAWQQFWGITFSGVQLIQMIVILKLLFKIELLKNIFL